MEWPWTAPLMMKLEMEVEVGVFCLGLSLIVMVELWMEEVYICFVYAPRIPRV